MTTAKPDVRAGGRRKDRPPIHWLVNELAAISSLTTGALFPRDVSEAGELLLEADEGPPADAADPDLPLLDDVLAA